MASMTVEERLALLEEHLAAQAPARTFASPEEDGVDPLVHLAELRKERGALIRAAKGKPSRDQERHLAALDAAIREVASGHEPEIILDGLLKERVSVERHATAVWQAEHTGFGEALTKGEHDQRVKDARAALAHVDEQIEHYQALVAKLST